MADLKDYSKLNKTFEYDKGKVTLLAEACSELLEMKARMYYLENLIAENKDLTSFVWTTKEGKSIALHDLEDDHLRNILAYCVQYGKTITPQLKAEALSRSIQLPTETAIARIARVIVEDDDYPYDLPEMD